MARIVLSGASGRMGSLLRELLEDHPSHQLVGAVVSASSGMRGRECADGVRYQSLEECDFSSVDVVLDFSVPAHTTAVARWCTRHKLALVVGTTGLGEESERALGECAKAAPVLSAPNMGLGVHALREAAKVVQRMMGDRAQIEITEIHHAGKKDSPSGTALALASVLAAPRNLKVVTKRDGLRAPDEIGVSSLRGGDVVGEHTVIFFAAGERIELVHRASDRSLFARGALAFAQAIVGKAPGRYSPEQIL